MPAAGYSAPLYDPGPQPGGREPAPGRLGLVQAFLNSFHSLNEEGYGKELFSDPRALGDWFSRRGLPVDPAQVSRADLQRALTVRNGLRALLVANNDGKLDAEAVAQLDTATKRASFGVRLAQNRAELVPHAPGVDGALAVVLSLVTEAMLDGSWPRFKACPGPDCGWAFFDNSRNNGSVWCSMQVCGGRAKQRAYYRRERR
jgi:predicted RNA-binding Zn ribbon-like protein